MVGIKALNNFSSNLLGWELRKCEMWERAFFSLGQPQKYSSSQIPTGKKFVLIDRVGGLDGKYLGRGHDVRTERSDVRAP